MSAAEFSTLTGRGITCTIVTDDTAAEIIASEAGVLSRLQALFGGQKVATAIGRTAHGWALAVRWYGFSLAQDNGWMAVTSKDRHALEDCARHIVDISRRSAGKTTASFGGRN